MMQFNKVCDEQDWENEDVRNIMRDHLHLRDDFNELRERKHWEWAMGLLSLKEHGFLNRDKIALGIGCGHEAFMYALTNHVKLVIGTDIYGSSAFNKDEADDAILRDPSQFCNFSYKNENLLIRTMDSTDMDFADNSFDILFSFSSLEHFGKNEAIVKSVRDSYRVLKKGGIYVLSVDYLLDSPEEKNRDKRKGLAGELFAKGDIFDLIINSAGFKVAHEIDFHVKRNKITNVYNFNTGESTSGRIHPHIYLSYDNLLFSSLSISLLK